MLSKQFFVKETRWYLLGGIGLFVLAGIAWWTTWLMPIALILALVGMVFATKKDLALGLALVLFELIIGGHGLLFRVDLGMTLTLRHVVFLGFILGYIWRIAEKEEKLRRFRGDTIIAAMFIWLFATFLVGGLENGWMASFDEFNAYAYFALLIPILLHDWTLTARRKVLIGVFGGILTLSVLTIVFAYSFNHLPGKVMDIPYQIFRDARVFEVTLQVIGDEPTGPVQAAMRPFLGERPYWYRIFHPGQIYAAFGILMYLAFAIKHGIDKSIKTHWENFILISGAALLIGMSRSILIGAVLAVGLIGVWSLWQNMWSTKKAIEWARSGMLATAAMLTVFVLVANFPLPPKPDLSRATFYETSKDVNRDVAVASRWSMLNPLHEAISQNIMFGSGFGKTVAFTTQDPRTIGLEEANQIETYRFEWGYQDIVLKMGLFGLALMLYLYGSLLKIEQIKNKDIPWIELGGILGVMMMLGTNIFTPYLNHPLGIGVLLVALIVKKQASESKEPAKKGVTLEFPEVAMPISIASQKIVRE